MTAGRLSERHAMTTEKDDMDAAINLRNRFQRRLNEQRSPSERLADLARLQQASFRLLSESPHGYEHFLRRNLESRRVEVVDGVWRPVCPARRAQLP
jgi:hypothetical protein